MSRDIDYSDDEIDLKELFLSLWDYKFFIGVVTSVFVVGAGYYALTADKVYLARSTFILSSQRDQGSLLSGMSSGLGGLAALAGLPTGVGGGGSAALVERVSSREFVLEVASEMDLRGDEYFNAYNADAVDPVWKATLKDLIGYESVAPDPENLADWNVLKAFADSVSIGVSDAGAIQVSVRHEDPERAAEIANHITQKTIALTQREDREEIEAKLLYLSQTLAGATVNLENSQKELKDYGLESSAQAVEAFAVGSVMLDELRSQRRESVAQLDALATILALYNWEAAPTEQDYQDLRATAPLVDRPTFRRMLGISEVVGAWSWPSALAVTRLEASIRDRIAVLDGDILKLEKDAKKYADDAGELARLTRNAKVSEATFAVLMEQVKGQSLLAGYAPESSKIIEAAGVPLTPVEPRRSLILALGAVLGLFAGSAVALILSLRRGVYFSRGALLGACHAVSGHRLSSVRYAGKPLDALADKLEKRPATWARRVVLELEGASVGGPFIVCDTSKMRRSGAIGRTLAVTAGQLGRSVALIDLSSREGVVPEGEPSAPSVLIEGTKSGPCVEYVVGAGRTTLDALYEKSIRDELERISKLHDVVLLCANLEALEVVISSPALPNPQFVAHVRSRKTKSELISRMLKRGTIEVALHD